MSLSTPTPETLFYDGTCGLCHRTVKFVLRRDRAGNLFRFAPLQGSTFEGVIPIEKRAGLPDSIVVRTEAGALLVRSDAVMHILRRLGGGWKCVGSLVGLFPRTIRDAGYDFVARIRYRIFGRRVDYCPMVPPEWRARFLP
ncbi:MAG: thiol-disulfide oxidoreductase DCC family protein [Candidatus Acidiferrales bacterium]